MLISSKNAIKVVINNFDFDVICCTVGTKRDVELDCFSISYA
jgi:hypothetical protein